MDRKLFADIEETHSHEEKLRRESMALIEADPELSRRLEMVQKAMALIFGYTIEHTSRSEDETTVQLLGIRLFNAAASGISWHCPAITKPHFIRLATSWRPDTCSIISARHRSSARRGSRWIVGRAGNSLIQ